MYLFEQIIESSCGTGRRQCVVVAAVSQSVGSPAGQLMSPHTRAQVLEPAAVDEVTCSDVVTLTTSRQDEHLKIHVSEVSRQVFKVMEAVLSLQRRPFGDRNMNCCSCQNKKKENKTYNYRLTSQLWLK